MEIVGTVTNLLREKDTHLWSISPDATVYAAIELMAAKNIGAVPVVQDGRLVGIVTDADFLEIASKLLENQLATEEVLADTASAQIELPIEPTGPVARITSEPTQPTGPVKTASAEQSGAAVPPGPITPRTA